MSIMRVSHAMWITPTTKTEGRGRERTTMDISTMLNSDDDLQNNEPVARLMTPPPDADTIYRSLQFPRREDYTYPDSASGHYMSTHQYHHRQTPSYPHSGLPSPPSPSASSIPSMKAPHSNIAYTEEQVDWIRYQKEDCKRTWDEMLELFRSTWGFRTSRQCLSSRYYRDNVYRVVNDDDVQVYDAEGKPEYYPVKVRERKLPEIITAGLAYLFVDKDPEKALGYTWVSPEHKELAKKTIYSGMFILFLLFLFCVFVSHFSFYSYTYFSCLPLHFSTFY